MKISIEEFSRYEAIENWVRKKMFKVIISPHLIFQCSLEHLKSAATNFLSTNDETWDLNHFILRVEKCMKKFFLPRIDDELLMLLISFKVNATQILCRYKPRMREWSCVIYCCWQSWTWLICGVIDRSDGWIWQHDLSTTFTFQQLSRNCHDFLQYI